LHINVYLQKFLHYSGAVNPAAFAGYYRGIISNSVSAEPTLYLQNYPNPFKGETSISFSLPEDGIVNISVFDIHGKVVRDLAGSLFPSGTSAIIWKGDDNQGRPVNPGIYVCRIIAGDHSKSIRMVVQ